MKIKSEYLNKVKGALYGAYIGDTMGATTEFMSKKEIKQTYGRLEDIIGGGWLNINPGEPTDDTEMSLMVMEALMDSSKEDFEENLANAFVKWYDSIPKDIGSQTSKAIAYYKMSGKFISQEPQALGNGSLMRNLPTALFGDLDLCVAQGAITHNNSVCDEILSVHCSMIQFMLNGGRCEYAINDLLKPTGYIKNTWHNVKYWTSKPTFEESIIGAVNDGGDADTIACIVGGIAGVKFGYEAIPQRWLDKLDWAICNKLDDFANWLIENKGL